MSEEFGVLRGSSLSPVVMLDESGWGVSGCDGSFAPGRGLGASGGGKGLVADGVSGMSWEFCCANRATGRNNVNPRTSVALIFAAIPESPYLSIAFPSPLPTTLGRAAALVIFQYFRCPNRWLWCI